jgi:hypothetical protein
MAPLTVDLHAAAALLSVPVKPTVCGEPLALSVMVTAAVWLPAAAGLNTTVMLQFPPAATLVPHALPSAVKSPLLPPVTAMLAMARAALPLFVSVIFWLALAPPTAVAGNVNEVGLKVAVAVAALSVPVSFTVCGESLASSVIVTTAAWLPAAAGLNTTLMLQFPPAATLVPHALPSTVKSPLLAPVTTMPAMASAALPLLFSVIFWPALALPTAVDGNVKAEGLRVTALCAETRRRHIRSGARRTKKR